jgi:hypothetical protein
MEQQVMGAFLVTTEIADDHEAEAFCLFYVYYSSFRDRWSICLLLAVGSVLRTAPSIGPDAANFPSGTFRQYEASIDPFGQVIPGALKLRPCPGFFLKLLVFTAGLIES